MARRVFLLPLFLVACGGLLDGTSAPPQPDGGDAMLGDETAKDVGVVVTDAGLLDAPLPPCSGQPTVSFGPKDVLVFPEIGIVRVLALGDVNGDGRLDVVIEETSYPQNVDTGLVFIQDGTGHFPAISYSFAMKGTGGLRVADVTNDGRADVIVVGEGVVVVRAGNASGALDAPVVYPFGTSSGEVVIADFDGDQKNDALLQTNTCGGCVWHFDLLLQVDGGLGPAQQLPSPTTYLNGVGDVNGDGLLDLVGVRPSPTPSPLVILPGAAKGVFGAEVSMPFEKQTLSPGHIVVGDVSGDGKDDVIVVPDEYPSQVLVSVQNAGALLPPVGYASSETASSVALGDVNGDCFNDVVVQHPGWFNISVYLQNKGGGLADEVVLDSIAGADVIAVGDVDGDGKPDIVSADQQALVIFHNTHP